MGLSLLLLGPMQIWRDCFFSCWDKFKSNATVSLAGGADSNLEGMSLLLLGANKTSGATVSFSVGTYANLEGLSL